MDDPMKKDQKQKKEVILSIRFDKETYDVLKLISNHEKTPLSKVIREMAIAYMVNSGNHDQLLASIDPDDQVKAQKTFIDSQNDMRDVFCKTIFNQSEVLEGKLDKQFRLLRQMLYLILYHSRPLPEELQVAAQHSAKERFDRIMKRVEQAAVTPGT